MPLKLLALFTLFVFTGGCSNGHIIHQQVALSRDSTFVEFSRDTTPYIHRGQVGGEHSTFIKVLGFEGDCFTVQMHQKGDAGFTVFGDGSLVEREKSHYKVIVKETSDLFTIQISALSYGDYVLTVTKK